jgi:hypothetical protein
MSVSSTAECGMSRGPSADAEEMCVLRPSQRHPFQLKMADWMSHER